MLPAWALLQVLRRGWTSVYLEAIGKYLLSRPTCYICLLLIVISVYDEWWYRPTYFASDSLSFLYL
jgi:hypothetical protein